MRPGGPDAGGPSNSVVPKEPWAGTGGGQSDAGEAARPARSSCREGARDASRNAASAGVPTAVVSNTISAANRLAAGPATAGVISPNVTALTEGLLKAMLMSKLKDVVAVVLLLGFLAATVTGLSGHLASAREHQPSATEEQVKAPPKPDREDAPLPDLAGSWQGDDWGRLSCARRRTAASRAPTPPRSARTRDG